MEVLSKVNNQIMASEDEVLIFLVLIFLIIFGFLIIVWVTQILKILNQDFLSDKKIFGGWFLFYIILMIFFSFVAFLSKGFALLYIYSMPSLLITTCLFFSIKKKEELLLHKRLLYQYRYSFIFLLLILLVNNNLSGMLFSYNLLVTLIFLLILAITLDDKTNINERCLNTLFFMLTISSSAALNINYVVISYVCLLVFWLIPQIKIKTKFNTYEKEMREQVDPGEINWLNRYLSQVFFIQILFREKINIIQKDNLGVIIYFLVLVNIFFLIKICFGTRVAFFLSFFLTSFDFNSRITASRFAINPKLLQKTINNLPELQKREMHRATQAVVDFVASHPVRTTTAVGALTSFAVLSYQNAESIAATDRATTETAKLTEATDRATVEAAKSTEATDRATVEAAKSAEATDRATAASEKYTQGMEKSRQDTNTANAVEEMKAAKTDDYYNLQKEQYKTGEIKRDEESLAIIDAEMKVRKEQSANIKKDQ